MGCMPLCECSFALAHFWLCSLCCIFLSLCFSHHCKKLWVMKLTFVKAPSEMRVWQRHASVLKFLHTLWYNMISATILYKKQKKNSSRLILLRTAKDGKNNLRWQNFGGTFFSTLAAILSYRSKAQRTYCSILPCRHSYKCQHNMPLWYVVPLNGF